MDALKRGHMQPRIIVHGGAGNITRENLSPESYRAYRRSLLSIVRRANERLQSATASALDVSVYAVSLLENDPLFNSGNGAVYTRDGTHELEASVMVSSGNRKRGVGVMKVTRVKNPILLAKEMLIRGEMEDGGGAQGHCQLEGQTCDRLAREWGLAIVPPSYFWTKRRWDEHRRGLHLSHSQDEYEKARERADAVHCEAGTWPYQSESSELSGMSWNGHEYLPQGTVGAVVLDSFGTVAVATSTGKHTYRILYLRSHRADS